MGITHAWAKFMAASQGVYAQNHYVTLAGIDTFLGWHARKQRVNRDL
jgi:hypothetical protein